MATTCFRPPPLPEPSSTSGLPPIVSCGRKVSTNKRPNLCALVSSEGVSLKSGRVITTVAIVEPRPSSSDVDRNKPIKKKSLPILSSTYRSFRDPVEEDEIQVLSSGPNSSNTDNVDQMEVKPIVVEKNGPRRKASTPSPLTLPIPPRAKSPPSSIPSVKSDLWTNTAKLTLFRSHSEGDLSGSTRNLSHPSAATPFVPFAFNKCLRVLTGSWKNLFQLGGMSRPPKPAAQVKKVAPPAVPDTGGFRHSGSSFGSAGYGSAGEEHGSFHDQPITVAVRDGVSVAYDVGDYGMSGVNKSPLPPPPNSGGGGGGGGGQFNYPAFTFPGPQYNQMVGPMGGHHGKAAAMAAAQTAASAYYHHQLSLQEDQGIDMTQSPGRDSPGSSGSGSRHSTASLDSGRASGCHLGPPHPHPRCSLSSSSVGSSDTTTGQSGGGGGGMAIIPSRVDRLLLQGVPDKEVLHSWLMDLHFEEYIPLFENAGYDMHTISRMTPEDLTAIGIKKPNHRKKLKAEIAQLNISDGLPDYIPGSLDEWLRLLRLEEYGAALGCQGYATIEDVTQLTWEDLEDIGIVKLGHQKKILLAIKRVKDLRAGKTFPPLHTPTYMTHQELTSSHVVGESASAGGDHTHTHTTVVCECPPPLLPPPRVHAAYRSFHQPWEIEATRHLYYATDIVPIKIRGGRGKSLESLEEGMAGGHNVDAGVAVGLRGTSSFVPAAVMATPTGWRPRSFDDGDITPTNECSLPLHEGGGTLPRPRGLVRPRPIAKIPATFCPAYRPEDVICGGGGGGGTLKRLPPSPPKRNQPVVITGDQISPAQGMTVTVVADLHCVQQQQQQQPPPPPAPSHSTSNTSVSPNSCNGGTTGWPPPPCPPATESQLIAALKAQAHGSDSSFKSSSSSTESDSLPFANENAGTIKQRVIRTGPNQTDYVQQQQHPHPHPHYQVTSSAPTPTLIRKTTQEPADVLNDIGNMLANLTDELDAMLEEEKRQGLTDD